MMMMMEMMMMLVMEMMMMVMMILVMFLIAVADCTPHVCYSICIIELCVCHHHHTLYASLTGISQINCVNLSVYRRYIPGGHRHPARLSLQPTQDEVHHQEYVIQ